VDRRFPRSLVRLAITLFIAGVAVSAYLEAGANDWLARHPISVNLISAFICFNAAIVALDRIIVWFAGTDSINDLHSQFRFELNALNHAHRVPWHAVLVGKAVGVRPPAGGFVAYGFRRDCTDEEWTRRKKELRDSVLTYLGAAREFSREHELSSQRVLKYLDNVEMIVGGLADTADRSRPEELRYLHVRGLLEKLYGQMMSAHRRQAAAKIRHTRRRGVDQD
jgi:hypothetical protein